MLRRHVGQLGGLVGEHDHVGALGQLAVAAQRLAAELRGQRGRPPEPESVHSTGSPQPRASAEAMLPEPMKPTCMRRSLRAAAQDWLKKPFSISRARSSAETSTLRGVSRNTLSAIRCIPPSSA